MTEMERTFPRGMSSTAMHVPVALAVAPAAVAYVEARGAAGQVRWGAGIDTSILTASLRAVLSAAVRLAPSLRRATVPEPAITRR